MEEKKNPINGTLSDLFIYLFLCSKDGAPKPKV